MDVSDAFSENYPVSTILDLTPIVGDVKGIGEAIQDPSVINIVAAAIGIVPVVGDTTAASIKGIKNIRGADSARNHVQDLLAIKRSKGNTDIAPGTRNDAEAIGQAWVNGDNVRRFELDHGGYGLTDGTRTFRLQYKPKDGIWKANFQENTFKEGKKSGIEIKNVHMNIIDMETP